MLRLALAGILVIAAVEVADANGRPPQTSSITFRQANEQHIVAGLSFGQVVSSDGGATWRWMCEKAIQYGGIYDPHYVSSRTGVVFATTPDGLRANRDGCSFEDTSFGGRLITTIALGSDNALYVATSDAADTRIYRSTDDGLTFPTEAMPGQLGDWWSSLGVAPSDPQRVYLAGYRLNGGVRTQLLFRSDNGGTSFSALPMTGITASQDSELKIVGIRSNDADVVYLRVTYQTVGAASDGIYRSTDGGQSWQLILSKQDNLAFVVRASGDLVAAAKNGGLFVSAASSNGGAWTPLDAQLKANCLIENAAGEVWACTQNLGPEAAGIMKSTDLVTWTPVLRYQDIAGPVDCPVGTLQRDRCVDERVVLTCATEWCCLRAQQGIVADPTSCPADVIPDYLQPPPEGCCQSGPLSGPMTAAAGVGLCVLLLRRRARSESGTHRERSSSGRDRR